MSEVNLNNMGAKNASVPESFGIKMKEFIEYEKEYFSDYFSNRTITADYIAKNFGNTEKYIVLFCDKEYIKENQQDRFNMDYLWDIENQSSYSESSYNNSSIEESLKQYHSCSKELTNLYLNPGEGKKFESFRDYLIK